MRDFFLELFFVVVVENLGLLGDFSVSDRLLNLFDNIVQTIPLLFHYYFNVCRIHNDVSSFTVDISNFCLLFFLLAILTRNLSVLLTFLRNQLSVSLILPPPYFCLFSVSWISILIFIIFFLLLTLSLFCSYFSNFM